MIGEYNKRGQFTLVVVLGLIIVLTVATFMIFKPGVEAADVPVPEGAEPVHSFVESCLESLGKDAVIKLGAQGGYTNPTEFYDPKQLVNPTDQELLELSPGSDLFIPYWSHLASPNTCINCEFKSEKPNLRGILNEKSISGQLSNYVEENLNSCIAGFEAFKERFDITPRGVPEAGALIVREKVILSLRFPLIVEETGKTHFLEFFQEELDVDLLNIYNTADAVVKQLSREKIVENLGINVLLLNSYGKNPPIAPIKRETRFGMGLSPEVWVVDIAKNIITFDMASYADLINVMGSKNSESPIPDNGYEAAFIAGLQLQKTPGPLQNLAYEDLEISFSYLPWWTPYMNINGREHGTVMSLPYPLTEIIGTNMLGNLFGQLQELDFVYDWSFPVMIEITQDDAFSGEGYVFRVAYEANIRNNVPLGTSVAQAFTVPAGGATNLCNRESWEAGPYALITSSDDGGVPDTQLTYRCGQETCRLGQTNDLGFLMTNLPVCVGGVLKSKKTGYLGSSVRLSSTIGDSQDVVLEMIRGTSIKSSIKKKPLTRTVKLSRGIPLSPSSWRDFVEEHSERLSEGDNYCGDLEEITWSLPIPAFAENLDADEAAFVTLERISEGNEETFSTFALYNGSFVPSDIELVPGKYTLNGFLMKSLDAPYIIASSERSTSGFIPFTGQDYTMEEIPFEDIMPLGGIMLNESNPITITQDDIDRGRVIFYVESANMYEIICHEDLEAISAYTDIPENQLHEFHPDFLS